MTSQTEILIYIILVAICGFVAGYLKGSEKRKSKVIKYPPAPPTHTPTVSAPPPFSPGPTKKDFHEDYWDRNY